MFVQIEKLAAHGDGIFRFMLALIVTYCVPIHTIWSLLLFGSYALVLLVRCSMLNLFYFSCCIYLIPVSIHLLYLHPMMD